MKEETRRKVMSEMGRRGGLKAGIRKLSPERRAEIAKQAAEARWKDHVPKAKKKPAKKAAAKKRAAANGKSA